MRNTRDPAFSQPDPYVDASDGPVSHPDVGASDGPVSGDAIPARIDDRDSRLYESTVHELDALRRSLLAHEQALAPLIAQVAEEHRASARNLAHYLALRVEDRRPLQERLARIGVSSLGRAESHVLANLDKVLGILHRLTGKPWMDRSSEEPVGLRSARARLQAHAEALLGPSPQNRAARIMVTLPAEAATDVHLAERLIAAGMDVARINCAHDDAAAWAAMASNVRAAAAAAGGGVRVLMDLAGPKLRTGPIAPGPPVLKLKPTRDELGRPVAPARLGLRASGSHTLVEGAQAHLDVDAGWLACLSIGDEIRLHDARGARRRLQVVGCQPDGALIESVKTVYFVPDTRLEHCPRARCDHLPARGTATTPVAELPRKPGRLLLRTGDRLVLTREIVPETGAGGPNGAPATTPSIACTLPEVFGQVRAGERIWFDDGRIGGVIREAHPERLAIEITQSPVSGARLRADMGINLPDSELTLPALTAQDIDDLAAVARHADCVGLSFVQRPADIGALRERLAALEASHLGLVLKIETRRAFECLPELLFAAMASPAAGVMIARGDLAVECGYERLAEVQEEILWAAEAAHLPVIWATQVLETLVKTGQPSRAEITDAAMSERAECVMLNKGPFIVQAMRTLDDIVRRMQAHQAKKRSLLRALGAWSRALPSRSDGTCATLCQSSVDAAADLPQAGR